MTVGKEFNSRTSQIYDTSLVNPSEWRQTGNKHFIVTVTLPYTLIYVWMDFVSDISLTLVIDSST